MKTNFTRIPLIQLIMTCKRYMRILYRDLTPYVENQQHQEITNSLIKNSKIIPYCVLFFYPLIIFQ